jgi:hypothetical protein
MWCSDDPLQYRERPNLEVAIVHKQARSALHLSPVADEIKDNELGGTRSTRNRYEKFIQRFILKSGAKSPLRIRTRRLQDNIKINICK